MNLSVLEQSVDRRVREIPKVSHEYIRIPILLNANTLVYSNV